ncbi:MAG: shikimate dehydrogenase [SAR202 cluster bacterium]|jgi:shikimate dehydrogenase|nr:shikimate dehydrogenase [Dehalococcoidia bacterium]MDP7588042.1 shikimate dehydrogenase [Dehalococcoidia bacterium]MQF89684.1 shikimate dehydrogenase [SAR202 cluster bacterium]MQG56226.1 shikimate dehydrogenase [SAR202 cluster bacterium]|tara:strand:- start:1970 stop:2827 length:858 start_codon:yes stop_codon:yes gene_type:complete
MTQRLGIIGYPIGHSISPIFQQAALDHLGIDATYEKWEVTPEGVGDFVNGLRVPDSLGINITVPHKQAVIPFLDEVDEWATAAGAVNTIVNHDGHLSGHNTDGPGFLRALLVETGYDPKGTRALVLGAGGAARGILLALARGGVDSMVIANRTLERAETLAKLAKDNGVKSEAISLSGDALTDAASDADLIVNCTTVGMSHGPDEHGSPVAAAQIPATAIVNDVVYTPLITPILKEAAAAGATALGGLHMLVYQGVLSFQMWTGVDAPVDVMLAAATAEMTSRGA